MVVDLCTLQGLSNSLSLPLRGTQPHSVKRRIQTGRFLRPLQLSRLEVDDTALLDNALNFHPLNTPLQQGRRSRTEHTHAQQQGLHCNKKTIVIKTCTCLFHISSWRMCVRCQDQNMYLPAVVSFTFKTFKVCPCSLYILLVSFIETILPYTWHTLQHSHGHTGMLLQM